MHAFLDARLSRKPTGIGNYVLEIGTHVAGLAPDEFRVICRPRHTRRFARAGARPVVQLRGTQLPRRMPPLDLLHGPNFHAEAAPNGAVRAATIHDIGYLLLPECHPPGMPARLDALVRDAVATTRMFLCNSHDTATAFQAVYGVESERVAVTPLGVDAAWFDPAAADPNEGAQLAKRYDIDGRYVLFVGAMVPRKDLLTLVRAWAIIARDEPDLSLMLAGSKMLRWASDWPHVEDWLQSNPDLAPRVRVLEYVSSDDLAMLYRQSSAVMLTSLLEGFGLTILEGMAAGRPIVATRCGALLELGGGAAYYGEPRDAWSFAAALASALADEDGERRASEARAIVASHTWRRTAELTLAAYREAVATPLL